VPVQYQAQLQKQWEPRAHQQLHSLEQVYKNLVNNFMNLLEIFEPTPAGYETEKDDNTAVKLRDLRKTKLTLKQLNRLRIMNDIRKLEHEKKIDSVQQQYKAAPADTGGM
jgi:hypothetical protein